MAFFLGLLALLTSHTRYREELVCASKKPLSVPHTSGVLMGFAGISDRHCLLRAEKGERI